MSTTFEELKKDAFLFHNECIDYKWVRDVIEFFEEYLKDLDFVQSIWAALADVDWVHKDSQPIA